MRVCASDGAMKMKMNQVGGSLSGWVWRRRTGASSDWSDWTSSEEKKVDVQADLERSYSHVHMVHGQVTVWDHQQSTVTERPFRFVSVRVRVLLRTSMSMGKRRRMRIRDSGLGQSSKSWEMGRQEEKKRRARHEPRLSVHARCPKSKSKSNRRCDSGVA